MRKTTVSAAGAVLLLIRNIYRNCSGARIQESGARSWNKNAGGDI